MAAKSFALEAIGTTVHVYKRRGTKSLRISIGADGKVKVTIPSWATYSEAMKFVHARSQWIQDNLPDAAPILHSGQQIGKAHRLVFSSTETESVRTRLVGSEIRIIRPLSMPSDSEVVQDAAIKACIKALRLESSKLLPVRLKQLAQQYGFEYSSVSVKQLKGRWGSCDTHRHITLNLFLMQLPWHLIDYVLLHELVHTKHLNHSADFWDEFLRHEPRAKIYRSQIRSQKPILRAVDKLAPVA
jgi:predicted metal-dependent hydrolase